MQELRSPIRLAGIHQGYRKRRVLSGIDLELDAGVTAVLGPNGAGKTTLLRTLLTDLPPRSGTIAYGDLEVSGAGAIRQARREIGFLPQNFRADPAFTVTDLVTYAAWLAERGGRAQVDSAIRAVGLQDQARTKIGKLSGGMKQRAGIAATIVGDPPIVAFDEPTVGLDPEQRVYFRRVLGTLRSSVVILSTHLIEDVMAVADRVVVMRAGAIAFDGEPQALADVTGCADDAAAGADTSVSAAERGYLAIVGGSQA